MNTIVLDNGSDQMKVGYAGTACEPRVFPNAVLKTRNDRKRVYIADQLDELPNRTSLFYDSPFERGYLLNWDKQLQIWDRVFGRDVLSVQDFQQTRLLLTDANCVAPLLSDAAASTTAELCFEIYQFHSLAMSSAPACVAEHHYRCHDAKEKCCLVVDSGHAFTHVVPFHCGRLLRGGVVRVEVGGKLLTNQLKEWVSYRQLNMMDETYVINQCKEDACFVSLDFHRDMERCVRRDEAVAVVRDYLLPDFVTMHRGQLQMPAAHAHGERQKLRLGVERLTVPELLFHPSDIEVPQGGLAEAISQSLSALPTTLHHSLLRNVVLIGGSVKFPGLVERLHAELRPLIDDIWDEIHISMGGGVEGSDPVTAAWKAGAELSAIDKTHHGSGGYMTRADYEEHGANICRKRFNCSIVTHVGENGGL